MLSQSLNLKCSILFSLLVYLVTVKLWCYSIRVENKRELIRVNITIETDEDDLLGGYRLKDGQTVYENGPVIGSGERALFFYLMRLT